MSDDAVEVTLRGKDLAGEVFDSVSTRAEAFTGEIKKAFESLPTSATVAAGAFMAIGAVGAIAISGITAEIIALGKRGSDVNDVTEAFTRLTSQTGTKAPEALAALREGTKGLLTDYDLMKRANVALVAGLDLSAQQYQTVGAAARMLAKVQGGELKDSYDTIFMALQTGKTKGIERQLGIIINAKDANKDLKASLAELGEGMTTAATLEQNRTTILEKLNEAVLRMGSEQLDFGEKVEKVKVGWTQFTDGLSVAVARSPVISLAMDAIGNAVADAFGPHRADTIRTLAGWIDTFAIGLVKGADLGVKALGIIGDKIFDLATQAPAALMLVDTVAAAVVNKTSQAFNLLSVMGVVGADAVSKVAAAAAKDLMKGADDYAKSALKIQATKTDFDAGVKTSTTFLEGLTTQMEAAAKQGITNEAIEAAWNATKKTGAAVDEDRQKKLVELGKALKETSTLESVLTKEHADHADIVAAIGSKVDSLVLEYKKLGAEVPPELQKLVGEVKAMRIEDILQHQHEAMVKAFDDLIKHEEEAVKKHGEWMMEADKKTLDVWDKANQDALAAQEAEEADSLEKRLRINARLFDQKRLDLDQNSSFYTQALAGINHDEEVSAALATHAWQQHVIDVSTMLRGPFSQAFENTLDAIPGLVQQALTGGGGLEGAVQAMGSKLGSELGTAMFEGPNGLANLLTQKVAGVFGNNSWLTSLMTKLPAIGGAIGSLVGPLLGNVMNGLLKTDEIKTNDLRDAFFQAQGGYVALHQSLIDAGNEAAFYEMWNAKSTTAWNKAVTDVNAALDAQKTKLANIASINQTIASTQSQLDSALAASIPTWDQVSKIAQTYGIDISKAGLAVQQMSENASAKTLLNDWKVWSAAGGDLNSMISGMSGNISKLVQDAMAFGTTLPENMKGLVQLIADNGLLVDKAGNTIHDLNGLTWGAAVETDVDKNTNAMQALTNTIVDLNTQLSALTSMPTTATSAAAGGSAYGTAGASGGEGFALGTGGLRDFGPGTRVTLHGREAVLTESQYQRTQAGPGAGQPVTVVLQAVVDRRVLTEVVFNQLPLTWQEQGVTR